MLSIGDVAAFLMVRATFCMMLGDDLLLPLLLSPPDLPELGGELARDDDVETDPEVGILLSSYLLSLISR